MANTGVLKLLWREGGVEGVHSADVDIWLEDTSPRWATRASQIIKIKYSKATKDIVDPIEDRTCHFINESG